MIPVSRRPSIHLEIQTHRKNPVGLLRTSIRKEGKVVHQSHGRITGMSLDHLKLIQAAFRKEVVPIDSMDALQTYQSKEYGGSAALLKLANEIGLTKMLYSRKEPWVNAALAMITGRLLYAGSKLSLVNRWQDSALWELAGIEERPDVQEHCYDAMDELLQRQKKIQKNLAKRHLDNGELVLYDITSSYLEGEYAESDIVRFGYNRDKKKGHKQIVIGLICNREGCPVAVEVFSGNTKDESTVLNKIEQLRKDFELDRIIFVGDRGMVTQSNYAKVKDIDGLNTISALTHPSILELVKNKNIEPSLFDERSIVEVNDPHNANRRLCLCKNPMVAKQERETRKALLEKTKACLDRIAQTCHQQATTEETIGKRIGGVFKQYGMGKFVNTQITDVIVGKKQKKGKGLQWSFDEDKIETEQLIDGCYVIASDVSVEVMTPTETVAAYKGLSVVEQAFRNLKTASLELRPIYHKTDARIKAHVFISMLSYYLQWHMTQRLQPLFDADGTHENRRWTLEGVLERLKSVRRGKAKLAGVEFDQTDKPTGEQLQILNLLRVTI